MSAKFVSGKFIQNVSQGTKSVAVDFVEKTTAWTRPANFPSRIVTEAFVEVARDNISALKPETARIAMKESEHQSDKDSRVHYTAYELDKDGKVISTLHLVKGK